MEARSEGAEEDRRDDGLFHVCRSLVLLSAERPAHAVRSEPPRREVTDLSFFLVRGSFGVPDAAAGTRLRKGFGIGTNESGLGKCSDFWLPARMPMALSKPSLAHTFLPPSPPTKSSRIGHWEVVSSHSSATVSDSHGVPFISLQSNSQRTASALPASPKPCNRFFHHRVSGGG